MKSTINEHQFIDGFTQCGRGDQFTRGALRALFEYFEQYEEDCDTEIEYDPIAICCEYTEYDSARDCLREIDPTMYTELSTEEEALEYLQDRTQVIEAESTIVIGDY